MNYVYSFYPGRLSTSHTCWDGVGTRDGGNGEGESEERREGEGGGGDRRGGEVKEALLELRAGLFLSLETAKTFLK